MKKTLFLIFWGMAIVASAEMVFPELPESSRKEPLIVQLAVADTQVAFRHPAVSYVRFVNQGDVELKLPIGIPPHGVTRYSSVWWHPAAKTEIPNKIGYPGIGGYQQEMPILKAKESLVIRLPEKLLPLGKHEMSLTYRFNGKEIKSNSITVSVVDQPLSDLEIRDLRQNSGLILENVVSERYRRDPWFREIVLNKLLIGSPYSVEALKTALSATPSQPGELAVGKCMTLKLHTAEILGLLADQERAARNGYLRDVSAVDLVLERIDKEAEASIKVALLKIVGKFFDVLDQPKKEALEKSLLVLLAHADAGVRVQAALTLLELFPAQRPAIETALAKPEFADETGRKQVVDAMVIKDKE